MLHKPEWHEPPTGRAWDEAWVHDAVAGVVADADAAYDPDGFWPEHEWDAFDASLPLTDVFAGAAGVAWALAELRPFAETTLDLTLVARRALERHRTAPPPETTSAPIPERIRSSLLGGEAGVGLVARRLGVDGLDDDLLRLVRENVGNDANELMLGVPGTLLLARAMLAATGEDRWRDAVRESEDDLRRTREADGLWTQRLWGQTARYLGPVHGLVGNVFALGEAGNAGEVLAAAAVRDGAYVNWPTQPGGENMRLQWCHGAPGIVATAAPYLDEDLLLGGARLVWDAGPPAAGEKGSGICHGTAGNGYALLKAFERTGDELWLDRARAFAVHALEQARRLPGRYSLFTGGVGAALFAVDCLDGAGRFPMLDRL